MDNNFANSTTMHDLRSTVPTLAEFVRLTDRVCVLEAEVEDLRNSLSAACSIIARIEHKKDDYTPEYIEQINQKIEWLQQRCEDFDRIFNWNTMILEGVNK